MPASRKDVSCLGVAYMIASETPIASAKKRDAEVISTLDARIRRSDLRRCICFLLRSRTTQARPRKAGKSREVYYLTSYPL